MATLQDYLGITKLRDAWPKWKANIIAVNNQIIAHVAGTADKHAAQDITYSGSFTGKADVKAAIDQAKTEIDLIVVSASIDPEVAFARISAVKAETFATLDARLEESEQDLVTYQAENATNVKHFGAKGDGVTDDTISIQNAIDYSILNKKPLVIPDGTYMINPSERTATGFISGQGLWVTASIHIILDTNAKLKIIPNALEGPRILTIMDTSNVIIEGGIWEGDYFTHLDVVGEWGEAIAISCSSFVWLRDMQIYDHWGNGLAIYNYQGSPNVGINSHHIYVENITVKNCGRCCFPIGGASYVYVRNCEFSESTRISPKCGVDIEPDGLQSMSSDITFDGCLFNDNGIGIVFGGGNGCTNIKIINCTFKSNGTAIIATGTAGLSLENVLISSNTIYANPKGIQVANSLKVNISNNVVFSDRVTVINATGLYFGLNNSDLIFSKNILYSLDFGIVSLEGVQNFIVISENELKDMGRSMQLNFNLIDSKIVDNLIDQIDTYDLLRMVDSILSGNKYTNNLQSALWGYFTNCLVSNNIFTNISVVGGWGILVASLLENSFITGNYFYTASATQKTIEEQNANIVPSVVSDNFARNAVLGTTFSVKAGTILSNNFTL